MKVWDGFDAVQGLRNPAVTVGSYDGVHMGHRRILSELESAARAADGESVVVTFSPHPRQVLGGGVNVQLLSSLGEKARLLADAGVDHLVVAHFTEAFRHLTSYDFVREYLIGRLHVHTLVVGYNHHFGYNQEGDYDYLSRLQAEFGFRVREISRQLVDDQKVSSTVVRRLIGEGRMEEAARCLGRPYLLMGALGADGRVVPGEAAKLLPPEGVYEAVSDGGDDALLHISREGTVVAEGLALPSGPEQVPVTFWFGAD
ncbi:MAG: FAD synthetase [Rikenellaceae bacterium]|nr:FAD synthetase [Rikenellaceae bacterium]